MTPGQRSEKLVRHENWKKLEVVVPEHDPTSIRDILVYIAAR